MFEELVFTFHRQILISGDIFDHYLHRKIWESSENHIFYFFLLGIKNFITRIEDSLIFLPLN